MMKIATRCMRALELSPEITVECQKEYGHAGPHSHALKEPYGVMYWEDDHSPPSPSAEVAKGTQKERCPVLRRMGEYDRPTCYAECDKCEKYPPDLPNDEYDGPDLEDDEMQDDPINYPSPEPPKTPPEMPKFLNIPDPKNIVEVQIVDTDALRPSPIDEATDLRCLKTGKKISNKKKANECKGCTLPGCKAKGDEGAFK